ncbi:hypothetical protein FPZ52_15775 (plasmid) [Qingshengfaniella alkalisoli]|uniref:Uncharacterized protein n=1 Tax=Qingshengfaniella alkalisoli TaxID=2599296 RepID=A0A5B8J1X2_9RHOB|nr:hypothetical protein [Qingshengfaniella alkalisoli]QDY71161.1 hypothetical protein FPZ52_15775 [Qingshengfaniella alkalisoli]
MEIAEQEALLNDHEVMFAAQFGHQHTARHLPQSTHDLGFSETLPLHGFSSCAHSKVKNFSSQRPGFRRKDQDDLKALCSIGAFDDLHRPSPDLLKGPSQSDPAYPPSAETWRSIG